MHDDFDHFRGQMIGRHSPGGGIRIVQTKMSRLTKLAMAFETRCCPGGREIRRPRNKPRTERSRVHCLPQSIYDLLAFSSIRKVTGFLPADCILLTERLKLGMIIQTESRRLSDI